MRRRIPVIPLELLADPPPLWRRAYYLLGIRARQLPIKLIFAGWFILAFLLNVSVLMNTGKVAAGTLFFELGLLLSLAWLFPWTLFIPASFIKSKRVYVLCMVSIWFGACCGSYLLAHFVLG
jgi:hypothetical protein